jgi:hypothetical protein
MAIPGTGVSLSPPEGATLLPLGPGLTVTSLDVTVMVSIAHGPEPLRRAFRDSLFFDGDDAESRPLTLHDGTPATLGRDVLTGPTGPTARLWLIIEKGERTLAVLSTFSPTEQSLERTVVASLRTLEWEEDAMLSPSEAIGISVGPIEGLSPDTATVGTLAFTIEGVPFPPPSGEPMAFVLPLAERSPAEGSLSACAEALLRSGVISAPEAEATLVEVDGAWGCTQSGTHQTREGGALFAHAVLLFLAPGPVLLTAMVAPERREEWTERFTAAAQTVRYLR